MSTHRIQRVPRSFNEEKSRHVSRDRSRSRSPKREKAETAALSKRDRTFAKINAEKKKDSESESEETESEKETESSESDDEDPFERAASKAKAAMRKRLDERKAKFAAKCLKLEQQEAKDRAEFLARLKTGVFYSYDMADGKPHRHTVCGRLRAGKDGWRKFGCDCDDADEDPADVRSKYNEETCTRCGGELGFEDAPCACYPCAKCGGKSESACTCVKQEPCNDCGYFECSEACRLKPCRECGYFGHSETCSLSRPGLDDYEKCVTCGCSEEDCSCPPVPAQNRPADPVASVLAAAAAQ